MFDKVKNLFNRNMKNISMELNLTPTKQKEPSLYDFLSAEDKKLYDEFDDKHYEAAQNWYDKYSEEIADIEDAYSDEFNYGKRITILKKAVKAYEKFYNQFSKYGKGGEIFLLIEFPCVTKEYTPTVFCKEYPVDFENINCINWLLQYYTEHKEEVTKILEEEYIDANYGSREEYEEEIRFEKHKKEVRKQLINLIKKNDGILQKDIYKEFEPEDNLLIKGDLKELSDNGTITRTKSGSTYSLHFNQ